MAIIHKGKYKRIGRIEVDFQGAGFINIILEVYNSADDRDKTKNGFGIVTGKQIGRAHV